MHHKHKHTHTHVYTSQRRICIIDAYNRLTCAPAYKNMHICAHTHSHCWQMHTHKGYNEVKKYNSHGSSEAAGYASGAAWKEVGAARRQWRLRIIKFPTNNQQRTCTCVCECSCMQLSPVRGLHVARGGTWGWGGKQTEKTLLSACPLTGIFIKFSTHKYTFT